MGAGETISAVPLPATTRVPRSISHGRLFRRYLLLILSLVTIALLASGGVSVYFTYRETKSSLSTLQHEKALAAGSRIEEYIGGIERQLAFVVPPQLDASGIEMRRPEFRKLLRQAPEVTEIAQLDATGHEQILVSRLGMDTVGSGKDRSQEQAFLHAKRGQPWFGRVYFHEETEPYITIALRAGGDNGSVIVADVNLKLIWDVVSQIKVGEKGKVYVVDGSGFLVADPDIGLVLRKTDLSHLAHVKAALAGDKSGERTQRSTDLAGVSVLASMAPIDPLHWYVFVEQPVTEVYETLNAAIFRTALLLLAGLVISALGALALAGGLVRPIRKLERATERIGAGDLDHRIEVHSGDDLEALAGRFNRMSAQLKESYAGLERKVEERTRELTSSLEQQRAMDEVLAAISSSIADPQPVFEKIIASCEHLFDGKFISISVVGDDGLMRVAAHHGSGREEFTKESVVLEADQYASAMCIKDCSVLHLADIDAENVPAGTRRMGHLSGAKTAVFAPMLWKEKGIGSIGVGRNRRGPFSDKEIGLLKSFADQAVIAIQNARLFREVGRQAEALKVANLRLEQKVDEQVAQLDRLSQLKRFFSPVVAEAIVSAGEKSILSPHRREICYVFVDLRGFTAFTDASEPEEVEAVLHEYHETMGEVIAQHGGTLDRFAGDGILIFFNDPLPVAAPGQRAVTMALAMQERFAPLHERWKNVGYELGLGIGIAQGYATLGAFGFEGRFDYSAIGSVVNLASRLSDEAHSGQVLIDRRTRAALGDSAEVEPVGPLSLKGFAHPVGAFLVKRLDQSLLPRADEVVQ